MNVLYLQICDFCVAQFRSSVVRKLDVPLAGHVMHQSGLLEQNGVENVLIGQGSEIVGRQIFLRSQSPQLSPFHFSQFMQIHGYYTSIKPIIVVMINIPHNVVLFISNFENYF